MFQLLKRCAAQELKAYIYHGIVKKVFPVIASHSFLYLQIVFLQVQSATQWEEQGVCYRLSTRAEMGAKACTTSAPGSTRETGSLGA